MKILIFFLILFFTFLIFYQLFNQIFLREGLTTNTNNIQDDDPSGNSTSLSNLEKEVQDLSGNVANLQTQVNGLISAQQQYATKNAPDPPNISLQSVS
jgi:uncharacterized protein YlxW (UPF0749 family)